MESYYSASDDILYSTRTLDVFGRTRVLVDKAPNAFEVMQAYTNLGMACLNSFQPFDLRLDDGGIYLAYREHPYFIKDIATTERMIEVSAFGCELVFNFPCKPKLYKPPRKPILAAQAQVCAMYTSEFNKPTNQMHIGGTTVTALAKDTHNVVLVAELKQEYYGDLVAHDGDWLCVWDGKHSAMWNLSRPDLNAALQNCMPEAFDMFPTAEGVWILNCYLAAYPIQSLIVLNCSSWTQESLTFNVATLENPDKPFNITFTREEEDIRLTLDIYPGSCTYAPRTHKLMEETL